MCAAVLCFWQDNSCTSYKPRGSYAPFCTDYEEWPPSHPNRAILHDLRVSGAASNVLEGHSTFQMNEVHQYTSIPPAALNCFSCSSSFSSGTPRQDLPVHVFRDAAMYEGVFDRGGRFSKRTTPKYHAPLDTLDYNG